MYCVVGVKRSEREPDHISVLNYAQTKMRSLLFWDTVSQSVSSLLTTFGTSCGPLIPASRTWYRYFVPKRPWQNIKCNLAALQKSDDLRYDSVEITNKMQPCNRIYYSTVHWRLNMFRPAYRSSSGALTVFAASVLHTHVVTGRSQVWVGTNTVRAPDDKRYASRNMLSLQWTVE